MENQFIITENRGRVTLDICTRNGIPNYYATKEYKLILETLNNACEAIKKIKSKKDYGSDLKSSEAHQ